jgi:RND family efflux transporter MFP subunit
MAGIRNFRSAVLPLAILAIVLGDARARAAGVEGFTEPYRKIDVAPAETGTIFGLLVHEGDAVRSGQQLATLDYDVLVVSLQIAKAGMEACGKLNSAIAERDLRQIRLTRLETLRERGHASQEEVDHARGELAVSEANLLSVQEQRQIDQLEYKRTAAMIERRTLRSPIDGIVLKIHKDEREFVSPNNATVFTVVQLDPLRIVFNVPTTQAAGLAVGQPIGLTFSEGGQKAEGKVEFIAPLTDAESGTVRVKVLLDNAQHQYRCGVRCTLAHQGIAPAEEPAEPLSVGAPK